PDYISKNVFWWLTAVPFLSTGGVQTALLHSGMLLLVGMVYYVRAKTEEKHLLQDSTYQEYSSWIDRHGIVARMRIPLNSVKGAVRSKLLLDSHVQPRED